jgi:phosphoribosylformimino-5-aminoimidazole carboxamide ribotide isomerase
LDLIPVVDLMDGQVVRARGGNRAAYRPWASPLAGTSDPAAVIRALLGLSPFHAFYLADLDAIRGRGSNRALIIELARRHPGVTFWVDEGLADAHGVRDALATTPFRPVLGTESLASAAPLEAAYPAGRQPVLSLDFDRQGFRGPAPILDRPDLWPEVVVVMALDRVGSEFGPDTERLRALRALAPDRGWFAAGGVRGPDDLTALAQTGARGALVASALHDGRLRIGE